MQTIQFPPLTWLPSINTSLLVSGSFSCRIVWPRLFWSVNTKRRIFTTPTIADIKVKNLTAVKHDSKNLIVIHSVIRGEYGQTLALGGHHPYLRVKLHHRHAGPVIHATSTQRVPQIGALARCFIHAGKKLADPCSLACWWLCQLPSTCNPPPMYPLAGERLMTMVILRISFWLSIASKCQRNHCPGR